MQSKTTNYICNKQVEHSTYPNLKDSMANNIMKTFANQSRLSMQPIGMTSRSTTC